MAQGISTRAHSRIRAVSTFTTIVVALAAAVLSWHGLTLLGQQAGFGSLSMLLPIVIDGAMVGGAVHVLHASLTGVSTRWGWGMTLVGVAISTWGNVVSAPQSGFSSAIVHAVPPLALAAMVEATMRIIRHGIANQDLAEPARAALLARESGPVEPTVPVPPTPPAPKAPVPRPRTTSSDLVSAPVSATPSPAGVRSEVFAPEPARARTVSQATPGASAAPVGPRVPLRAVPAPVPSSDLDELASWMREEVAAGRTPSAARAFEAGLATSLSTAKRRIASVRSEHAHLLEMPAAAQVSASRVVGG